MQTLNILLLFCVLLQFSPGLVITAANNWGRINLPVEQLPFYFNLNPKLQKKCEDDETCPYKEHLNSTTCYGYERNCKNEDRLFLVNCPEDSRGWVGSGVSKIIS